MRAQWGNATAVATEIGGHFQAGKDKIVRPLFGPMARLCWPVNTDAHVAAIAKCDPRTARRYLSGEIDPPAIVWATMWVVAMESRVPK